MIAFRAFVILTICFFSYIPRSYADIEGAYNFMGTSLKFYYKDDDHIRIEMKPKSHILILNENIYMVAENNGQSTVMDMSKFMEQMPPHSPLQLAENETLWNDITIEPTGEKEKIAEIEGELYIMTATMKGERKEFEIVVSQSPEAIMLQSAYKAYVRRNMQLLSYSANSADVLKLFEFVEGKELGGIIRVEDTLEVTSAKKRDFTEEFFNLPENYIDLFELQQQMQRK